MLGGWHILMRVSDNFGIKCDECNHVTLVKRDSLECDTSTYDRKMGTEIEYIFSGEICCEKCNSWISFSIRGYEYPVGAFNFSDCECNGGDFVDRPTTEIEYEFDDNYSDYVYEEYIETQSILKCYKEQIKNMSSRDFEFLVGNIFKKLGFSVKVTQETRDGGHDLIVTKASPIPYTLIVECKHWGENHKVDVSVVRSVYGVQMAEQADQSVVVTSSKFTKDARKFAKERKNLMTLWDIDDLLELVMS